MECCTGWELFSDLKKFAGGPPAILDCPQRGGTGEHSGGFYQLRAFRRSGVLSGGGGNRCHCRHEIPKDKPAALRRSQMLMNRPCVVDTLAR